MRTDSISQTAWIVVLCQLALKQTQRFGSLVSDEAISFYQACFDYCRAQSPFYSALSMLPRPFALWLIERALARGAPLHFVLRKQKIAEQVEKSIQQGVTQIVVIGAGFDIRALSTAQKHANISCIEIDMPAMHRHKIAVAQAHYGVLPSNFHAIAADLSRTSLKEVLSRYTHYSADRPTLFIAEGLVMYLREAEVTTLLSDMRALSTQPASLVFTAVDNKHPPTSRWGRWLRDVMLTIHKERFFWMIPPASMTDFLSKQGYDLKSLITYQQLQVPWRSPQELAAMQRENGEYIVIADGNPK